MVILIFTLFLLFFHLLQFQQKCNEMQFCNITIYSLMNILMFFLDNNRIFRIFANLFNLYKKCT